MRDGRRVIKSVKGGGQVTTEQFNQDMQLVFVVEFTVESLCLISPSPFPLPMPPSPVDVPSGRREIGIERGDGADERHRARRIASGISSPAHVASKVWGRADLSGRDRDAELAQMFFGKGMNPKGANTLDFKDGDYPQ